MICLSTKAFLIRVGTAVLVTLLLCVILLFAFKAELTYFQQFAVYAFIYTTMLIKDISLEITERLKVLGAFVDHDEEMEDNDGSPLLG